MALLIRSLSMTRHPKFDREIGSGKLRTTTTDEKRINRFSTDELCSLCWFSKPCDRWVQCFDLDKKINDHRIAYYENNR